MFEQQALATPNNTAIVFEGIELTYCELNAAANSAARFLIEKFSITSNDVIGILLQRSEKIIITILAVLKAGATYLPIDMNYPRERQKFMVKSSGCRHIICEKDEHNFDNAELIDINSIPKYNGSDKPDNENNFSIKTSITDRLYIIFTSGSTGEPKGCQITNSSLLSLMSTTAEMLKFTEKDVWIMAHSHCFDFSVWEMYGALLFGGKIIIPTLDDIRDTYSFLTLVKKHKVSVLNQTPGAFYRFIDAELSDKTTGSLKNLRYVIFGGDKLNFTYLSRWLDRYTLNDTALINMYGITETTVHVTYHFITADEVLNNQGFSIIGKPLPNVRVYVFDKHLKYTPPDYYGELYVSGSGVCMGYVNRNDLTAERFIKNPYN